MTIIPSEEEQIRMGIEDGLLNPDGTPKLTKLEILEAKFNALLNFQGLTVRPIDNHQYEVIKEQMPTGDYTNPIPFVEGMTVQLGLFYSFDDGNIWECIKDGTGSYTSEYFDIIEV